MPEATLKNSFNSTPSQDEVNDFVAAAGDGNSATVLEFLNKYPTSIDARSTNNVFETALMWAIGKHTGGRIETVKMLLENGASVDEKTSVGRTAVMWAAMYGYDHIIPLLLESGADIHATDNHGNTALALAQDGKWPRVVKLLQHWPKIQEQRLSKWLKDTDCSSGLKKAMPAPRHLRRNPAP